jgi:hypothetical protein
MVFVAELHLFGGTLEVADARLKVGGSRYKVWRPDAIHSYLA